MESKSAEKLLEQSSGILGKAYDDLIHPSAKSLGNTISLLPRTVGVWLSGWEKWIINGEESIRLTAQAVQEKASKIPEEKLVEPEPYVAVPAIQQLSYCYNSKELREMYANLLVSAMNRDIQHDVHPAFVDIIKQLSPLDAKALQRILSLGKVITIIDIKQVDLEHTDEIEQFRELCMGYSAELYDIFQNAYGVSASLDNLARLGLVEIYHGTYMDLEKYERYETDPFLLEVKNYYPTDDKFRVDYIRGTAKLTTFGIRFCEVCCEERNS